MRELLRLLPKGLHTANIFYRLFSSVLFQSLQVNLKTLSAFWYYTFLITKHWESWSTTLELIRDSSVVVTGRYHKMPQCVITINFEAGVGGRKNLSHGISLGYIYFYFILFFGGGWIACQGFNRGYHSHQVYHWHTPLLPVFTSYTYYNAYNAYTNRPLLL